MRILLLTFIALEGCSNRARKNRKERNTVFAEHTLAPDDTPWDVVSDEFSDEVEKLVNLCHNKWIGRKLHRVESSSVSEYLAMRAIIETKVSPHIIWFEAETSGFDLISVRSIRWEGDSASLVQMEIAFCAPHVDLAGCKAEFAAKRGELSEWAPPPDRKAYKLPLVPKDSHVNTIGGIFESYIDDKRLLGVRMMVEASSLNSHNIRVFKHSPMLRLYSHD